MSIGDHFRDLTKMIPYTKLTAVFSLHIMLYGRIRMVVWRLIREIGSRSCIRKLACNSQTTIRIMNKEVTLGTSAVPAHLMNKASKTFRDQLNRVLPAECQIKTRQDAWYAGAIFATVVSGDNPPSLYMLAI